MPHWTLVSTCYPNGALRCEPSCLGRRMCATAAHLNEHVLPEVDLRQGC
jgi:hypothetical protein